MGAIRTRNHSVLQGIAVVIATFALSGCVTALTDPVFGSASGSTRVAAPVIAATGENIPQDGSPIRLPSEKIPYQAVTTPADTGSPTRLVDEAFKDWTALDAEVDSGDDPLRMAHAFAAPVRKTGNLSRLYSSGKTRAPRPLIDLNGPGQTDLGRGAVANTAVKLAHTSPGEPEPPGRQLGSVADGKAAAADRSAQVHLASAAGLARLVPNGLRVQHDGVQTACLKPGLLKILADVRRHFGREVVITSGYRSAEHQRRIGGVSGSRHITCEAADIQVPGVSKWELATYLRSIPGRGGVGTYCYTKSVHIDIGTKRDWNWGCKRR